MIRIYPCSYIYCMHISIYLNIHQIHTCILYICICISAIVITQAALKIKFSSSSSSKDQRFSKHVKAFDQFTVLVMPLDRRRCTADFLTKGGQKSKVSLHLQLLFLKVSIAEF